MPNTHLKPYELWAVQRVLWGIFSSENSSFVMVSDVLTYKTN